ncbi:acetyl/propionyl/methylcrotonyl-CoA carboxylase subunit alpha [Pseudodonghicola flavimaris]|uniref:Acetyl/propionyl/methylcrotonyl-CoA carboxylase subunit alpha n=1 Tax=Pseudodonghicola flavimaris TaxID=3050036 RepID=A0ABT7EV70_9RHOB|nr:acetyl/propionyl/methylcrotonyl-CoA carboxylase subunit alpha [Pseudodonghicola flavimaris]MDK3016184.1 acetyl/propionyl/methylcrotonyl-CoA carboxylase subunit alpha [Pseudodonghicola flavimaris]
MFKKILIANRGEIACRIIETARAMGVGTVAVYSEADAGARHVVLADEAFPIGPPQPAESYLKGQTLIEVALKAGAQAVHPGYGFLSENPDFVEAVEAAGLTFIGPSASAIRAMGLKDAAKALMEKAGVPVVPGYHGDNQDPEHLAGAADTIGYPVLIKAVAGGGGKGMRRVARAEDFADALDSARGEARTAFGNDAVLIEKYVEKPRHIEVQVFGDGQDAVHLYERDCSLQRRHQKVIEEAPAPGMTAEMRAAMGEAAVRAAKAIGYKGAGTIEFIVDASDGLRADRFWFMEMNTRLQVEHPVTEAVTGIDLVEWQLRVAAGEPLPMTQVQIPLKGHAFEARLYAEDVPKGFLPATGTLTHLEFPTGARIDSGVRAGDTISPFYDPMIAKVITHGPTREIALARMTRALERSEVAGSVTNLTFLAALTRHAGFAAGDVDTGLIERDLDGLIADPVPEPRLVAQAALAASGLMAAPAPMAGFTLWASLERSVTLLCAEAPRQVTVRLSAADRAEIVVEDRTVIACRDASGWRFDGARAVPMARAGARITLFSGAAPVFDLVDPLDRAGADAAGGNLIEAPMPGLVKAVFVAAGETVAEGQRLAILEAMKMEHTLVAARDGVVAEVLAAAGDQVEAGAALVRLEEDEA